jgi:hypothetical protein
MSNGNSAATSNAASSPTALPAPAAPNAATTSTSLESDESVANALTDTKREFLNSKEYSNPLYWAPFTMYGL